MPSPVPILRRAMLPLDGSIAEHASSIVSAYGRLVPPRHWPEVTFVDLTAGSCVFPLHFAARGAIRLVINDTAERTQLAAAALFGGCEIEWPLVRRLLATQHPSLEAHVPSFHIASDYLTEAVAEIFDRLYFARQPAAYRYLALRWALGFAPAIDKEWEILPTHDPRQLRADRRHDWRPYLRRAANAPSVLKTLVSDINAAIRLVRGRRFDLRHQDMLELCRTIDYGRRALVVVNPPTDGLDEYVIDDQLAHSLMANRWLPLSRSDETPAKFWTRRVAAALDSLPRGSHAIVWGGDGAVRWNNCWRLWTRYATPVAHKRAGSAGWAILEKRRDLPGRF